MPLTWQQAVLGFWFDELTPKDWFEKNDSVDQRVRDLFLATYESVSRAVDSEQELASPAATLATLIVLDQFPLNLFRGTPRAFESDAKALALAHAAVDRGLDVQIEAPRRIFIYLPFEHSEALVDQNRSVALFEQLGDPEYLRFAIAHHDIVSRFGRFPHRNATLGRTSTPEELAFLATPGSGF